MNKDLQSIDKNFCETIKLFNDNNIDYWICHGTLLGIIRDNNLIPWDHDIDLAVWDDQKLKEKIKDLLLKNSYKLKEKYLIEDDLLTFTKEGGREVDINFYKLKTKNLDKIAYVEWFVPKNIFNKIIEALSKAKSYNGKYKRIINKFSILQNFFNFLKIFLIKRNLFFKCIGYTQPYDYLKMFKNIEFKGITLRVPYKCEDYLIWVYGKNWKKPKKNFNWIKDSPSTREI